MEIFIFIFGIVVIGGFFALYLKLTSLGKNQSEDQTLKLLNQTFSDRMRDMTHQFQEQTKQVNLQLAQNADILQKSNRTIGERLDNAAKVVSGVTDRLGQMEEANKRIYDVGKDIASLQDILRAPKLRGSLGEFFLGDLLSQYFPKEQYSLQYTFKNGEKVDAALHLADGKIVPIDSKFPMENFKKMLEAKDDKDKKAHRKTFVSDVKKRIDEISKYILPDEGTLDFALLYIPAENIYYEVIIKDEGDDSLGNYAFKKRVIPVSPNNFFVYIQTVLMGLRGLQIEQNAKQIMEELIRIKNDFTRFGEDFDVLGSHIVHSEQKYDESKRRLEKIGQKMESIEQIKAKESVKLIAGKL